MLNKIKNLWNKVFGKASDAIKEAQLADDKNIRDWEDYCQEEYAENSYDPDAYYEGLPSPTMEIIRSRQPVLVKQPDPMFELGMACMEPDLIVPTLEGTVAIKFEFTEFQLIDLIALNAITLFENKAIRTSVGSFLHPLEFAILTLHESQHVADLTEGLFSDWELTVYGFDPEVYRKIETRAIKNEIAWLGLPDWAEDFYTGYRFAEMAGIHIMAGSPLAGVAMGAVESILMDTLVSVGLAKRVWDGTVVDD